MNIINMDPSCLGSAVQAAAGGPSVPPEHGSNPTAYLRTVADHVHPFMTTVDHLLMETSAAPCLRAQISSHWFIHSRGSTVTRSQSSRAALGCGGAGDSLCDAVMETWTNTSDVSAAGEQREP